MFLDMNYDEQKTHRQNIQGI